jgi:hypothetical protein
MLRLVEDLVAQARIDLDPSRLDDETLEEASRSRYGTDRVRFAVQHQQRDAHAIGAARGALDRTHQLGGERGRHAPEDERILDIGTHDLAVVREPLGIQP